jgi:hypothetical protein
MSVRLSVVRIMCNPLRKSRSWPRTSPSHCLLRPTRPNRHTIRITTALGASSASNTISNPGFRNARTFYSPQSRIPAGKFQMRSTLSRQPLTNLKILQLGSEHGDPRNSVNSRILTITVRSITPQSEFALVTSARNVSTSRDWASYSNRPSPGECEKRAPAGTRVRRAGALISLSPDVWARLSLG